MMHWLFSNYVQHARRQIRSLITVGFQLKRQGADTRVTIIIANFHSTMHSAYSPNEKQLTM